MKGKNKDGTISFTGYCIDLLNELARNLHFTYDIYPSPDGNYGAETGNGTWNGMIGELINKVCDREPFIALYLVNFVIRTFSTFWMADRASKSLSVMVFFSFEQRFQIAENKTKKSWKEPSKMPFHCVSRDQILHYCWSILAALFSGAYSGPPFPPWGRG